MEEYFQQCDSPLGMKDWNQLVASAKDILQDTEGEGTPEERLQKIFTFLNLLEIKRAIEQAREEMDEE